MGEVYGAITDQILINLSRYFPYYKSGSNVPKSAFDYQASMLAQMGQVNRDTINIIKSNLKGANASLVSVLEQTIIEAVKRSEPALLDAVKKGIFNPATNPIIVSPNQYRAFDLYYKQAAQKMNLVNTVMLESTKQAYQATVADVANRVQTIQTALDIGAGETMTGVSSWNQALRHSMDRLKANGITGFIDHGGHKWSAEAYVSMDIRTTVYNTSRAAVWETNQNFGNDLYIVSYHDGARPLCFDWQNKVISSLNAARDVTDLDGNTVHVYAQSETTYGEPAGLFGINCKHYPSPFIPGVSVQYDDSNIPSEEENKKVYEQTQEQRKMERKLREEKRDLMMAKAMGADDEEIKALRARCRQTSDDIDAFCQDTGLPRRQNREGVYTERKFPDPKTYDVSTFEHQQKDEIEKWFKGGGAQQEFTAGQMTPNEPLVPNPVVPTPAPITPPTVQYGEPFNTDGYRKPQLKQFESAKDTLTNAPESARNAWNKVSNDLKRPDFGSHNDGAFYSPGDKRTHYESYKKCFEESSYQRKNAVFFHEYGHNIDNLLGGGGYGNYLSMSYVNKDGKMFVQVLEKEIGDTIGKFYLKQNNIDLYDAVKAAQNAPGGMGFGSFTRQMLKSVMPTEEYRAIRDTLFNAGDDDSILRPLVDKWLKPQFETELRSILKMHPETAKDFCTFVKTRYSIYQTTDVSDIYGNYMTRTFGKDYAYPFGVGHKVSYQNNPSNMAKEAFAEFFSAMVTGSDSMVGINDFLPESYKFFEEMLGSVQ